MSESVTFGRTLIELYRDLLAQRRVGEHGDPGSGCSFEELLCHDLHTQDGEVYGGFDFKALAVRWGVPLPVLGILIADHCYRLAGIRPVSWLIRL